MTYEQIRQLARDVYEETASLDEEARADLVARIKAKRLGPTALDYAAWILLHEQKRLARGVSSMERRSDTCDAATNDHDEEESIATRWRYGSWPLGSGRRLHEATEQEIVDQIETHRRNEQGNRKAAEFHEKVLALRHERGLKPNAPCSRGLTEEDFDRTYREVYGERRAAA